LNREFDVFQRGPIFLLLLNHCPKKSTVNDISVEEFTAIRADTLKNAALISVKLRR
jgi:hypothetical protein